MGRSATAFLDVQAGRAARIDDDRRGVDTRRGQVRGEVAPETVVTDPGDDRCRNPQCRQGGRDVHFGAGRATGEGRRRLQRPALCGQDDQCLAETSDVRRCRCGVETNGAALQFVSKSIRRRYG